jgi:hypothetical protein
MKPSTRLRLVPLGVLLTLVGGLARWTSEAGAAIHATPVHGHKPMHTPQPYGVNFTIHPLSDPNFCVVDTPSGGSQPTPASIAECAPVDSQHWTFAQTTTKPFVAIDGNGQCLDFGNGLNGLLKLTPCTFATPEHFLYDNDNGQLESTNGKLCLQAQVTAQSAAVVIEKCKSGVTLQQWQIGH